MKTVTFSSLLEHSRIRHGEDELVLIDWLEGKAKEGFFEDLIKNTPKNKKHSFAFFADFNDLCECGGIEGLNNILDGSMMGVMWEATDISYTPLSVSDCESIVIRVDCILEEV